MRSTLVPFDGSQEAEAVLRRVVQEARDGDVLDLHLLNVQPSLGGYVSQFVGSRVIRDFQMDCGRTALASGKRILDMAGVSYRTHIRVGEAAHAILRTAAELGVDQIVMAGASRGLLGKFLQLLLVARVIRRAAVPVLIVSVEVPRFDLKLSVHRPGSTYPW